MTVVAARPPRFQDEPVKRPKRLADRCSFTFRGHPTTAPNTPADTKRIALSQWITNILVRHGDELLGAYQVPGATGYSPEELALAPTRYAHLLKEKPVVPEPELQLQALQLLRSGFTLAEIAEELELPVARFKEWRESEAFALVWQDAKDEGAGRKVRSNAARDSRQAVRASSLPTPQPMPALSADIALQTLALEKLRSGQPSGQVMRETPGLNCNKLAAWRRDPVFATKWEEAKAAGRPTKAVPVRPQESKYTRATVPDAERQAQVLELVRSGTNFRQILAERLVKGFHTNALGKWRKDPAFKQKWDEALAAGREVRGTGNLVKPQAPPSPMPTIPIAPSTPEAVHGPAHYNGTEVFDQMVLLFGAEQVAAFCRLNAYKYRMRAGKKPGNSIEQDISKALWYEQRLTQLTATP